MSFSIDYAFDHPSVPVPQPTRAEKLVVMARELVEDGYRLSGLGKEDFTPTDANCGAAKNRAIAGRQSGDPGAYEARLDTVLSYFREARIVFEENDELWALKTSPLYQEAANAHVLMISERTFFNSPAANEELKSQPCTDRHGAEYGAQPASPASGIPYWRPPAGQSAPAYVH